MFSAPALDKFKEMVLPVIAIDLKQGNGELTQLFFGKKMPFREVENLSREDFFFFVMSAIMLQISETKMKFEKMEVIGSVPEGDNMVHVVGRLYLGFGPAQTKKVNVTSLIKIDGKWGLMLTGDVKNMVEELKRMVMGR